MRISYKPSLKEKARWLRNNMPKAEVVLWQNIKGKQLLGLDFHRQKPLLNYIVDFYCPKLGLVLEVDGFSHDYKMEYDKLRQGDLEACGLHLLRFRDSEVLKNTRGVIQRIVDWVGEHTPVVRPSAADHPSL